MKTILRFVKHVLPMKLVILALTLVFSVFFSCSNKQGGIDHLKIGEKEGGEAYIGQDLPIYADIVLPENIAEIEIHIASTAADSWSFEKTYSSDYSGKREVVFDEEIQIPVEAKVGHYEVTLKARGVDGTVVEKNADIQFAVDSTVPVVGELEVGINAAGNDLHLETDVTAAKKIRQITVVIKGEAWSKDFVFEKEQMQEQMTYNFHEHVHVDEAPAGEYEVQLTVEDQAGRTASASNNFQKK